jgi:hypothetical protein
MHRGLANRRPLELQQRIVDGDYHLVDQSGFAVADDWDPVLVERRRQ